MLKKWGWLKDPEDDEKAVVNKPPLFNLNEEMDFELIYGEYCKHWNFWKDYSEESFIDFQYKVYSLEGKVSEVFNYRSRYLNKKKMSKEEYKVAKSLLNNEQKEYEKIKRNKYMSEYGLKIIESIGKYITNENNNKPKNITKTRSLMRR